MNSIVIEEMCVGTEHQELGAGREASRRGHWLGGGVLAVPNAGPQLGVGAASAGKVVVSIKWSPDVAWRKQVELSRR